MASPTICSHLLNVNLGYTSLSLSICPSIHEAHLEKRLRLERLAGNREGIRPQVTQASLKTPAGLKPVSQD